MLWPGVIFQHLGSLSSLLLFLVFFSLFLFPFSIFFSPLFLCLENILLGYEIRQAELKCGGKIGQGRRAPSSFCVPIVYSQEKFTI